MHQVIRFSYSLWVNNQAVAQQDNLTILSGFASQLPPGLEGLLLNKTPGAYSLEQPSPHPYDPALRVEVPLAELPDSPKLGSGFSAEDANGALHWYRVVELTQSSAILDGNPPWAGQTLQYRFTIHSVRPAHPDEVAHGHVHGEGGVEH